MAMPAVVVSTEDATVSVPSTEDGDFEVTREWVESLFANVSLSLLEVGRTVSLSVESQTRMSEILTSLLNRLPENLTQLISMQQQTITDLTGQVSQIAAR